MNKYIKIHNTSIFLNSWRAKSKFCKLTLYSKFCDANSYLKLSHFILSEQAWPIMADQREKYRSSERNLICSWASDG